MDDLRKTSEYTENNQSGGLKKRGG